MIFRKSLLLISLAACSAGAAAADVEETGSPDSRSVNPLSLITMTSFGGPEAEGFWAIDGYSDEELAFRFR